MTSTDVNLAVEKSRASRLDMVNQVTKAFFSCFWHRTVMKCCLSYKQSEDNYNVVKAKYEQGLSVNMIRLVRMCRCAA